MIKRVKRILSSVIVISLAFVSLFSFSTKQVKADTNPGIEAFVRSLYSDCLGRDADPSGLNDWCTKLANGTVTGKECAFGFFFSSEFISKANRMSDESLINAYYRVFLNRSSDLSGASYWAGMISNTTNDIGILFTGFADSEEFANKCASYGIVVGDHLAVPETVRTTASATPAPATTPSSSSSSGSSSGRAPNGWFDPPAGNEVWLTENGSRYHCRASCSGMIDPAHTTLAWARANGYTACGRCY